MVYDSVVCTELSKMGNYENNKNVCGGRLGNGARIISSGEKDFDFFQVNT